MVKRLISNAGALGCALGLLLPGAANAATGSWPQFLHDDQHTSYSPDPQLTASSAPQLGIKWMANLFSTDLGSPVVAYNTTVGKTVAYVGNERADVFAIDVDTGSLLWSTNVGLNDRLRASPMVASDGTVWVGTAYSPTLFKLDGATGAVECSLKTTLPINGSPMVTTPAGGAETVYWDTIDGSTIPGPTIATRESDCSQIYSFTNYRGNAGPWVTPAYAVTKTGEPIILIGTADNDSTEYAIDAITGTRVWDFAVADPPPFGYDIGAATTVSPPGANGFADGVAYVNSKFGVEYALDLTNGTNLWQFDMYPSGWNGARNSIGSAAFDGTTLALGYRSGVYAINAATGTQVWNYVTPAEVASSPAITGPSGNEAVSFGDLTGAFRVVGLSSGTQLYSHQTGGYITSSAAIVNGSILIASSDGFLYSFTVGGSNVSPPSTAVSSPADGSTLSNPNGTLTVSGSSSDPGGVAAVEIAIQTNGTSGSWYNAVAGKYASAPSRNAATLASPGSPSSTWTFSFPAPAAGGTFKVFANTVGSSHVVDRGATSAFTIKPSMNQPTLKVSFGYVAPADTFTSTGNAFKPGETVNFTLFGAQVASAVAGQTGNVPQTTINVPPTATFGPTSLTATGASSGKTATATIYVTNTWNQFGGNSRKTSDELHDTIIKNTIDVGPNSILSLSWLYATGAPVNTSPAIVDGVAYVGNDAGVLTAVRTQSGAPSWTFSVPSHAPIRSSPAVDQYGAVIFGANDGNLYMLRANGALIRTIAIGGNLGNPTVANSKIVVASDNGMLYFIDDSSGAILWSKQLAGPVHSSPAYDPKDGLVIVGDDTGTITAFNSATGQPRWTASAHGSITGAPALSNGVAYVTSADGNLYAMKERTGIAMWHFLADSPILSGVVVGGAGNLTFGTQAASVYQVTATGALQFREAGGRHGTTPIVGISGTDANQVTETAGGLVSVTRDDGTGFLDPWDYQTGASLDSSPAIINGTVYIGAGDGGLYAFSPNGATPMDKTRGAVIAITDQNSWSCVAQP